jgi:3'(2'), 5'-bisphosphate nucleotidase
VTLEAAEYKDLAFTIMEAAQQAGLAIMDIYRSTPKVRFKPDNSPVTDADQASETILIAALSKLMSDVPVVAEERTSSGYVPRLGRSFFLVDPLDGTKEFLKFNGEFAINVALVEDGKAVFGLIYAPDKADCYVTLSPGGAYRCPLPPDPATHPSHAAFTPLNGEAAAGRPFRAIVSHSHLRPEAVTFLENLGNLEKASLGSSLKFGVLARGDADVYPRFGPTSEWDTAAGHAILEAAGGCTVTLEGQPLRYGKRDEGFTNPAFIAWRRCGSLPQR